MRLAYSGTPPWRPFFERSTLEIKNRTHAYYTWHRNQDGSAVAADSMWFTNRYWEPTDDSADDFQ